MKKLILLISVWASSTVAMSQGGVSISTTLVNPDASSMLDVTSSDKGVLIPRVSLTALNIAAPIVAPANSLLIYNTATSGIGSNAVFPGFYHWDATLSSWSRIASGTTIGSDDQNIDSIRLVGNTLTTYIENGTSASVNLSSLVGTDNQNIDSIRLVGNILTTYIENGTSASVDLSSLIIPVDTIYFNDTTYKLLTDSLLNDTTWLNEFADSVNTDNQNIDSIRLVGNILTTYIEDGSSASVDLSSIVGTDDQNIDSIRLVGNILTTYIEDGSSASVDLSSIVSTDDQNIDSIRLVGNILTTYIEDGSSASVDLSSIVGTDNQNIDSIRLVGNILTTYIEDGSSASVDLSSLIIPVDTIYFNDTTYKLISDSLLNDSLWVDSLEKLLNDSDWNINTNGTGLEAAAGNNFASGDYSIAAGQRDTATGPYSTISGGRDNKAEFSFSTISGGAGNTASNSTSTIAGGSNNTASGDQSFVGGGNDNTASGSRSTVSGGGNNTASGIESFVGGGNGNQAQRFMSTIAGGDYNTASGIESFVGGGNVNEASGERSTVSGGSYNTASGNTSTVSGGFNNVAFSYGEWVGGMNANNYTPASASTWNANDRIFAVGNGSSAFARSNAITILKNANTGIAVDNPQKRLHVDANNDSLQFENLAGTGTVLGIDAAGKVYRTTGTSTGFTDTTNDSWQDNPANNLIELKYLSNGSTLRTGDNKFYILDSGRLTFGDTTGLSNSGSWLRFVRSTGTANLRLQASDGNSVYYGQAFGSNNTSVIRLTRGRGTKSAPLLVEPGDVLGQVGFWGYTNRTPSNEGVIQGATIWAEVDSGIIVDGQNRLGTRIVWRVSNGASNPRKRMTLTKDGYLGIGSSLDPQEILHINANNDSLQFENLAGTGTVLGIDSNGKVYKTIVSTASASDSDWNINANGTGLEAAAGNNFASGDYAIAAGQRDTATGPYSTISGGVGNTASNSTSTIAGGAFNTASGVESFVGGGNSNEASGLYSTVSGGGNNTASITMSTIAGGFNNTASGVHSFVGGGKNNTASNSTSTIAGGSFNTASGNTSTVSGGFNNVAFSYGEWVGGMNVTNYTPASTTAWNATDRIFAVGNGSSAFARSNAITILKNANTGIAVDNPQKRLHVDANNDSLQFENLAGTGTVLGIDAAGKVYKATVSTSTSTFFSATATYNVAATVDVVFANSTTGAFDVTLPDAATFVGRKITVKRTDNSVNNVTIKSVAGNVEMNAPATGYIMSNAYEKETFMSDGTNWWIISQ